MYQRYRRAMGYSGIYAWRFFRYLGKFCLYLDYADSVKFNLAMFMSKAYISKVILMYGRFPDHHCGIIMSKDIHSKVIVICGSHPDYHCGFSMHGDIVKFH